MATPTPTRAYLLRSVDYRDADRIVTLLTEEHGKLSAMARGARKSRKRFAGALQPACLMEVSVVGAQRGMATLTEARVLDPFLGVLGDLERIGAAGAGFELVREVAQEGQPEPEIFAGAGAFLGALHEGRDPQSVLLAFWARVLSVVGLAPSLERCALCGREAPADSAALYRADLGSVVCRACGGGQLYVSAEARRVIQAATEPDFVPATAWPPKVRREVRDALLGFAQHQLGKRLASAEVLAQIENA